MNKSLTHYKEAFLEYLASIQKSSDLTVKTYEIALRQMLEHALIEEESDQILIFLMPFRQNIARQNKKTITKKLSAIRSFVHYLNDKTPLQVTLKDDASVKVHTALPKPIEHRHIIEALKEANEDEKLLVVMLYSLGLRISELASIKLEDIKPRWLRVTGKGGKMRDIPLSEILQKEIEQFCAKKNPKTYFFEKNGVRLSEDSLRYKLTKIFKRIGMKVTPHQLRHSFATSLLNNGARIEDVSELLGHESIATTQIYTKLASTIKMQNYNKAHPLSGAKEDEC